MRVSAIKCLKCGDIKYSRHVHDCNWCSCRSCSIDGGRYYTSVNGNTGTYEFLTVEVDATPIELEYDYTSGTDKYGTIHTK